MLTGNLSHKHSELDLFILSQSDLSLIDFI